MIIKAYICVSCKNSFEKEVLEPGEAQAKNIINVSSVRCPTCGSTALINPDEINK